MGALMMGKFGKVNQFAVSGLARMAPVAIMLLGTGTLAGIIAASSGLKGCADQRPDRLRSALLSAGPPISGCPDVAGDRLVHRRHRRRLQRVQLPP